MAEDPFFGGYNVMAATRTNTFGERALGALSAFGRIKGDISLAVGVCVAAVLLILAAVELKSKYSRSTPGTVQSSPACVQGPDGRFQCTFDVAYEVAGRSYTVIGAASTSAARVQRCQKVNVQYDPTNPSVGAVETSPKLMAVALALSSAAVAGLSLAVFAITRTQVGSTVEGGLAAGQLIADVL